MPPQLVANLGHYFQPFINAIERPLPELQRIPPPTEEKPDKAARPSAAETDDCLFEDI